ncbi:hypothetical protein EV175_004618 [Coemansia sp. RSA 1933]|nr:hypothetical protein EV175_004618 [Coemansia sp. RSA 1933]
MPRPIAASSGSQAEQANRKGTGAALRSRTGAPADSVERLRLRVDMVEAENRMLRLKSEQDKAHLAAGQMLARDLAIVNGSTSSPTHNLGSSSGPSGSDVSLVEQQLKVARDTLERERAAAKETIVNLENEIRGLKTSSTGEGSPSSNGTKQGAYMDISDVSVAFNSLPDSNKLESKILELQSMLDHAKESHVQDTLASENAYSQLRQTLEDKNSTIASMKAQISGKGEETSALKLRIEAITAELDSTTRLYQGMLKAEDVGSSANEGSSNPAIESALSEQVDRLHTEVASAKSAKAELVTGKQALSATGDDLSRSQGLLKDAQSMPLDYENLHGLAVEYHVYMHRLARLIGERGGEHGDSVRLALDGMPVEFDKSKVSLEAISQLFSRAIICLNQLLDNADSATKQIEAAADEIRSKDTHISVLDMEILDLKRQLAQSPSETLADFDDHDSAPQQYQYLQSRIEELESMNEELSLHRDGLIRERAQFNEQFNMLEAESNRLVEDIDRLTAQNKKLSEDLRVTSLQNSTVSLDMASLESKLSGEPPAANLSAMSVEWNADTDNNTTAAIDDLRRKYELEISALKSSLVEMELRKNREIKKLEDDVATAEMVAEDKVFNEYDLNRKIVELTDEVDRLQRKNQRSSSSEPAANGVPTTQTDGDHATFNGSNIAKSPPPASDSFQFSGVSASSAVHEASNSVVELIDDESMYCDICDSPGHVFSDCPQMTAPSNIFKQRVSIDSSRPYCDNCEEFGEHWTDDCPHGDEMF